MTGAAHTRGPFTHVLLDASVQKWLAFTVHKSSYFLQFNRDTDIGTNECLYLFKLQFVPPYHRPDGINSDSLCRMWVGSGPISKLSPQTSHADWGVIFPALLIKIDQRFLVRDTKVRQQILQSVHQHLIYPQKDLENHIKRKNVTWYCF